MFKTFVKLFLLLLLANGCCNISYSSSNSYDNTDILPISINQEQVQILNRFVDTTPIVYSSLKNQINKTFYLQKYSRFNATNTNFLNTLTNYSLQLKKLLPSNDSLQFNVVQYINIMQQIKQQCNNYIEACKKFYLENKSTTDNLKHLFTYNKQKLQGLIDYIQSYIRQIDLHIKWISNQIYTVDVDNEKVNIY